ncbi:MAG: [FeFe] hydrogenase H-cluster maturation GTPase HydF [Bacteroidales bacterium]
MNKLVANRPHLGIFGRRNTGKSSLINALTGQQVAIVSDTPGTTTDVVKKSIEIFGVGPVVVMDTAGIDDEGDLGRQRVETARHAMRKVDLALLVVAGEEFGTWETDLVEGFRSLGLPYIVVINKTDLTLPSEQFIQSITTKAGRNPVIVSATQKTGLEELISAIKEGFPASVFRKRSILEGLVSEGDWVVLVTPIDNEAPEGRMILPQVMAIRDVLDHGGINVVLREDQVEGYFSRQNVRPAIVVTDSQVFGKIHSFIPEEVPFTSFSILMTRKKGFFEDMYRFTPEISNLRDGDKVLILESCSHQVNCDDIGRFKLPGMIRQFTGVEPEFDFVQGLSPLPEDLKAYQLAIQCGGCMVTDRQLGNRVRQLLQEGIPVTNYGMALAWMTGIFNRVTQPVAALISETTV